MVSLQRSAKVARCHELGGCLSFMDFKFLLDTDSFGQNRGSSCDGNIL